MGTVVGTVDTVGTAVGTVSTGPPGPQGQSGESWASGQRRGWSGRSSGRAHHAGRRRAGFPDDGWPGDVNRDQRILASNARVKIDFSDKAGYVKKLAPLLERGCFYKHSPTKREWIRGLALHCRACCVVTTRKFSHPHKMGYTSSAMCRALRVLCGGGPVFPMTGGRDR